MISCSHRQGPFGPIIGCASSEPEGYVVLPHQDSEWLEEQNSRRMSLMWVLEPTIAEGDIIALEATSKGARSHKWKYGVVALLA